MAVILFRSHCVDQRYCVSLCVFFCMTFWVSPWISGFCLFFYFLYCRIYCYRAFVRKYNYTAVEVVDTRPFRPFQCMINMYSAAYKMLPTLVNNSASPWDQQPLYWQYTAGIFVFFNTSGPEQNDCHFANNIFKIIFCHEDLFNF